MAITGAVYRHPEAYPDGSSAGSHLPAGPAPRVKPGLRAWCRAGEATRPPISLIPAACSSRNSRNLRSVTAAQRPTRSSAPTRCGPHSSPAAAEVVRCGGAAAYTVTARPAPASATAVLRPHTPAPITTTSGLPARTSAPYPMPRARAGPSPPAMRAPRGSPPGPGSSPAPTARSGRMAQMQETDPWAPLARQFARAHYATIRGRVRTHVIDAHLRAHLPPPPAALVDVGGGAGNQSIPLARSRYQVTIADSSEAMLAGAAKALANEPPEVAARVRLVKAAAEDAGAALGGLRFAAVLCHGVIMYAEDPRPFTAALADLAEPGGIVSVVAKNARCIATRPALERRWQDALAAFDSDRQVNGLGVDTRADTVEDLSALLSRAGVEPVAWYGVRLFTDGWVSAYDEADQPGTAGAGQDAVLAVELEASRRDPYRQLSRLFHLVGVRPRPCSAGSRWSAGWRCRSAP